MYPTSRSASPSENIISVMPVSLVTTRVGVPDTVSGAPQFVTVTVGPPDGAFCSTSAPHALTATAITIIARARRFRYIQLSSW